jgi:hypothetical protein
LESDELESEVPVEAPVVVVVLLLSGAAADDDAVSCDVAWAAA